MDPKYLNKSISKTSFGPAPFYRVENDNDDSEEDYIYKPVHRPIHWWYRGKELACLTQFEYYALIDIIPISIEEEIMDHIELKDLSLSTSTQNFEEANKKDVGSQTLF